MSRHVVNRREFPDRAPDRGPKVPELRAKAPMPRRRPSPVAAAVTGGGVLVCVAGALCAALGIGILVGRLVGGGDTAAERRLIEARAFELSARALVPGSPLACLDSVAAEIGEGHCERAIFATP